MSSLRFEAQAAREIVETALDRQLDPYDDGRPPAKYDFHILESGRPVGALEVTSFADERALSLDAAIGKRGDGIHTEAVGRRWWIGLDVRAEEGDTSYREIMDRLPSMLAAIEAEGRESFHKSDAWDSPAVMSLVDSLPVESGGTWDNDAQPRILLHGPGRSTFVSGEIAHRAIEEAAAGERFRGEREKLSASGMNERHLFVWVSVTVFDVWSAVHDCHPPSRAPILPEEITTVWFAAMAAPGDVPVWRAARGEPWTLVERAADA